MSVEDRFGLIGQLLERKYRVDRAVAEGGFGIVYAGHHIALDAPIAIKVLKRALHLDDDAWDALREQFLAEARTVAKITHPGVVKVLDAGTTNDGLPWIVMEWIAGETLADDLARRRGRGGRSPAETLALLRPVIEALGEAHELGIAHRDLKPSNVMLVKGRARVLDFGIAKTFEPHEEEEGPPSGHTTTESSRRVFTAAAAAPEQLAGTRTGPWTDVHAIALLFTELLTDAPPYPAGDATDHIRAVFDASRPTPGKAGVDVGEWEPILARALSLKPNDRHTDANAFLAAIDAVPVPLREGVAPSVPPVSRAAHTVESVVNAPRPEAAQSTNGAMFLSAPPAARRWPRAAIAIGVVAALAIAGGARLVAKKDAAAPPSKACTSHAACTKASGSASACMPEIGCVPRASVDCDVHADPNALASDDTVWIGTMFPKTGPDGASFGLANDRAVELARRDFAQTMSASSARLFGVISCDDAVDPRRAATHLVAQGVPAVIGFHSSVEAMELASSIFLPKKIATIAALNTNPLVTRVPASGPRLVWRTTYSSANAAAALSAFVETLAPTKVALIRPKHAAGAAFSETVFATLRFNGKSALDNGYAFRELTFEEEGKDLANLVEPLARFAPNVILYAGPTGLIDGVFAPLEARWPKDAPRPRYASVALMPKELLDFIGSDGDRRKRFFGVTPVSSTPANARFVMHYNEAFPEPITRTIAPNSSYDAFYLLAYATYALPRSEPVTGPSLTGAFARLVPSASTTRTIDVGLSSIFDGYTALANGQSFDLDGATGPLDFDLATGEAPFDQAILCAGIDEGGKAFDGIESGLVFSAKTKRLEGSLRCP